MAGQVKTPSTQRRRGIKMLYKLSVLMRASPTSKHCKAHALCQQMKAGLLLCFHSGCPASGLQEGTSSWQKQSCSSTESESPAGDACRSRSNFGETGSNGGARLSLSKSILQFLDL